MPQQSKWLLVLGELSLTPQSHYSCDHCVTSNKTRDRIMVGKWSSVVTIFEVAILVARRLDYLQLLHQKAVCDQNDLFVVVLRHSYSVSVISWQ